MKLNNMSWRTNSLILTMRNIGRTLGLNRWIASWLSGGEYETRFYKLLSTCIQPRDCVWDIGANVGFYTGLFAERVGPQGQIFAVEPSPLNYHRLAERCSSLGNVRLLQCGLGRANGKMYFQQGADELGATSRVIESGTEGEVVEIRSGDSLLEDGSANSPNVIKCDVEGFEWEVLEGMSGLLGQPCLRAIGIEVHFGILNERGMRDVPKWIERLLNDSGFAVTWPDSSHIFAVREQ